MTLGKGTPAEANIDPDTALKLQRFITNQFKLFVTNSATDLDFQSGGVFVSPNDSSVVDFLRLLDPNTNYSFVMTAFDNTKIPFTIEITYIDPVTEDEATVFNALTVDIGRDIVSAKIYFKSALDNVNFLAGYIVGILAVGM